MKLFTWMLLGICLLVVPAGMGVHGQTGNTPASPSQAAPPASSTTQVQPAPPPPASYTLSPERRAKAIAYSHTQYVLYFIGTLLSLCIYLLFWRARIAVTFREWACKISRRHFVQCLVFVPLFVLAATVLNLPLDYYSGFVLEHRFGLSTQGFASWLSDWGKSLLVAVRAGGGSISGWCPFLSS
jgi:STE24 endopeptidase